MYQEILNQLKAKFQGVSENVLSRIAKNLAKTVTTSEQVKTAVDSTTLQQVIDSYADGRATEASQTAVHNYEQKWQLKDGVKISQGGATEQQPTQQQPTAGIPTSGGAADQTPQWAQTLIEQNKALTERIANLEGERTTTARKQQISTIVSKLPETLRKPYEHIALDKLTEEEFNTLVSSVTTEVDGIASDLNAKGAVFGRPSQTGGKSNQNELTEAQQKAIAHRDAGPVGGDGQPF